MKESELYVLFGSSKDENFKKQLNDAEEILKERGIEYIVQDDDGPPLLVAPEGAFSGLKMIHWYAKNIYKKE